MEGLLEKGSVFEFCDYLDWAFYSGVELKQDQDYSSFRANKCFSLRQKRAAMIHQTSSANQNIFSTTFLSELKDVLSAATDEIAVEDSRHYLKLKLRADRNREIKKDVKAEAV